MRTRDRMVAGAADLLRRRGVKATTLREVVQRTRTPRGSLGHHFPQGKTQLLEEALRYARRHVSEPLQLALEHDGPRDGLRAFTAQWRHTLQSTRYEAGCPVMAVALEQVAGDGAAIRADQQRLRDLARQAFDEWAELMAAALRREGVTADRARSLSVCIIAAFEGAIGLCRTAKDCRPLDHVSFELDALLELALRAARPKG